MNTQTRQALRRGALAGMGGGMIIAMWSMIVLWLTGAGLWTPLNLIANTVWRPAPLGATFSGGALALGLAIHMMTSMGLGMAFAVAARAADLLAASRAALAVTGMIFGMAVWVVMQYGIWPALDAAAAPKFTPWVFALGHLMFGAATALLAVPGPVRHGQGVPPARLARLNHAVDEAVSTGNRHDQTG